MSDVTVSILRLVAVAIFAWLCSVAPAAAMAQEPKQQTETYVPIKELPPQEQLPSAPLLVAAYSFVVVVLFLYLLSVARRLTAVQRVVERLEGDLKRSGRA